MTVQVWLPGTGSAPARRSAQWTVSGVDRKNAIQHWAQGSLCRPASPPSILAHKQCVTPNIMEKALQGNPDELVSFKYVALGVSTGSFQCERR